MNHPRRPDISPMPLTLCISHPDRQRIVEALRLASTAAIVAAVRGGGPAPRAHLFEEAAALATLADDVEGLREPAIAPAVAGG